MDLLADKKSEALHDRMIMVRIPYNLKVSQEERIYEKLLRQTNLQGLHIAPHALHVAAIFAILSRLEEPKTAGLTLLKKYRNVSHVSGRTEMSRMSLVSILTLWKH